MADKLYLTPDEVAEVLGTDRDSVYKWLRSGKLHGCKLGRIWRIHPEDMPRHRVDLPGPRGKA